MADKDSIPEMVDKRKTVSINSFGLSRLKAQVTKWGFRVVKWGCILHCVSTYGLWFNLCSGTSMEPTLHSGDIILVSGYSRHFGQIKRNDVICLLDHTNPKNYLCKRLIGLEGDTVFNDANSEVVRIPRGYIWIEGDNREEALDSRHYGAVPFGLIQSKVIYRFGGGFI